MPDLAHEALLVQSIAGRSLWVGLHGDDPHVHSTLVHFGRGFGADEVSVVLQASRRLTTRWRTTTSRTGGVAWFDGGAVVALLQDPSLRRMRSELISEVARLAPVGSRLATSLDGHVSRYDYTPHVTIDRATSSGYAARLIAERSTLLPSYVFTHVGVTCGEAYEATPLAGAVDISSPI